MNKKLVSLTEILRENSTQTAQSLSVRLHISTRTVRNLVREWDDWFHGCGAEIEARHGVGYLLCIRDQNAFEERLKELSALASGHGRLPCTCGERVEYLLNDLLNRRDYVTIEALSNILYITRKTISADLKEVERILKDFHLSLSKRPNYGIRIEGTEFERRQCIASVVLGAGGEDGLKYREDLNRIAQCVTQAIDEKNYTVCAIAYQNLIVHIYIALRRISENCYVPLDKEWQGQLQGTTELQVARKIADGINASFHICFPCEEIEYIAIHLAGKQSLPLPDSTQTEKTENVVISEDTWTVVTQMLEATYEAFLFDFRKDLELRMNLALHIVPLAVRMRYNMRLKNPLLKDIKTRFSLAYAIALHASSVLTEHYGSRMKEDEVGYLALAFALAIERQNTQLPRKNILIVCASGEGSARLLQYRYRQEFASYVDHIETCDVSNVNKVDFSGIDYVFTTVPIDVKVPVPVQEVKYFLDSADIQNMKSTLRNGGEAAALTAYVDEALFFPHLKFGNRRDTIQFLCRRVMDIKGLPKEFGELVEKREEAAPTAFGNMVAIPHPWKAVSSDTFVCVGILDKPVEWGEQEVQVVFLVSISNKNDRSLRVFYKEMVKILTNRDSICQLIKVQLYDKLLEILGAAHNK